jgi:hypothetical protein
MSNRVLLSASAVINAARGVLRQMTERRRPSAGSAAAGRLLYDIRGRGQAYGTPAVALDRQGADILPRTFLR